MLRKESWRQLAPVVMWWMEMECQRQSIAGCSENTGGTGRTTRYRVVKTGVFKYQIGEKEGLGDARENSCRVQFCLLCLMIVNINSV